MKRRGRHPEKALSAVQVKNLKEPGRYADGNGLYVVVDKSGAKRWILRTVIQGKRRDIGLGSVRLVGLSDARERAAEYRSAARDGRDPVAEKRRAKTVIPTFAEAGTRVHEGHSSSWKNGKHEAQWISTLKHYAFPILGERGVDQIDTPEVLKVLAPIWLAKPETARRVMQRMRTIFDWAKASGFRSTENPVHAVTMGLPRQPEKVRHHAALPYGEVPVFIARLREFSAGESVKLAFEFLILTGTRTGEVLGAKEDELDRPGRVWTIAAERMKAGREHRVPLTPRALDILDQAHELSPGSHFIFASQSPDKPLSNMVFLMTLRRMGVDTTAHGFRSAFRDWAAECTTVPAEVCEMALAHSIRNKTEAAYRRGDLFEKRRELMLKWEKFLLGRR